MKSIIEVEINAPSPRTATLFADPLLMPKWMHDLDRVEPLSGAVGKTGSKFRMVPKKGKRVFVATVTARRLPREFRLQLDHRTVTAHIKGTLRPLEKNKTLLVSEEVFRFKGLVNRIFGLLARRAIRNAHRRHIRAFKRVAEQRG